MIPGIPAIEPHGPYDRDPGFIYSLEVKGDLDDVWETEDGIYSQLAPEALLLTEPRLWHPFGNWCLGKHELSDRDREEGINFDNEAIVTMTSASRRVPFKPAEKPEEAE